MASLGGPSLNDLPDIFNQYHAVGHQAAMQVPNTPAPAPVAPPNHWTLSRVLTDIGHAGKDVGNFAKNTAADIGHNGAVTGAGVTNLINIPLSHLPGYKGAPGVKGYVPVQKGGNLPKSWSKNIGNPSLHQYIGSAIQTGALGLGGVEKGGSVLMNIAKNVAKNAPAGAAYGTGAGVAAGQKPKQIVKTAAENAAVAGGLGVAGSALGAAIGKARAINTAVPTAPKSALTDLVEQVNKAQAETQKGVKITPVSKPSAVGKNVAPETPNPITATKGEGGYVANPAAPVKDFLDKSKQTSQAVGDLQNRLAGVKGASTATEAHVTELMKSLPKFNKNDLEAAYHYSEDKSHPVTPEQKAIYDTYVKPIQDATARDMAKLKKSGIDLGENYTHRIAMGKGTGLERFLGDQIKTPREGGILRKTTSSMQPRTMKALTDEQGNRLVASIKPDRNALGNNTGPKQVTAFINGKPTRLGALNEAHPINGKTFVATDGKTYKIGEATTKEIEANTNVRYYKNPIVNAALNHLEVRRAAVANDFLEKWKTSPEFKSIALKHGDGSVPDGWKTTQAPQFRGYYFSPKVAETLDDFQKNMGNDPLRVLSKMNNFLRTTIFYNPLIHVPNVAATWATDRGVSGLLHPVRLVKTGVQAVNVATHPTSDMFQTLLKHGAPLMSAENDGLAKSVNSLMEASLKGEQGDVVSKALGFASKANLLKAWYNFSHKVTWGSNDIMTIQRILERQAQGKSLDQAIADTNKFMLSYRVPPRILGSRELQQALTNNNLTMFMPYHISILRGYKNAIADVVKGSAGEKAAAADKLAMGALVAFVAYPALDRLAKTITGNPNAVQRRSGPYTIPSAIVDAIEGRKSTGNAVERTVTPAPATTGLLGLFRNKDHFGNQIYDPKDVSNPKRLVGDIGSYISHQISPVNQVSQVASGKSTVNKAVSSLFGISQPKSDAEIKLNNMLDQQFGNGGMTKQVQRNNAAKAAARAQIQQGQGDSLAQALVKANILKQKGLSKFEKQATWTPQQRAYSLLSKANRQKFDQSVSPEELKKFQKP